MPVIAYYDGSGHHAGSAVCTLAGLVAPADTWRYLDDAWLRILREYGLPAVHSTDLASFNAPFERRSGWDEARRKRLLTDLFNLLSGFRSRQLQAYSCSVLTEEYARAKDRVPGLKPAESMCVDFCIGGLQLAPEDLSEPHPVAIYFDRGEPFLKRIDAVWRRARRSGGVGWPQQIRSIQSADASCPGIQAADLFAWTVNRQLTREDNQLWAVSTLLALPHFSQVYDCDAILQAYEEKGLLRPDPRPSRPLCVKLM